ncbi:MAG: M48 family metallopeptidase [Betaproteobacteria bacterium]|nr:M48 family metallopeptidase [Betaproteobacteria bacterium]
MAASTFTWIFLAALAAATATRLWLAQRQRRHVREHRAKVPDMFAATVPLAAHQKAADYSAAKAPLAMVDLLIGVAALLALTLGGALDWTALQWAMVFAAGSYAHGVALVMTVVVVLSALDLPLAVYRTFVVEARFGFNRLTPALFLADLARQALIATLLGVPLLLIVLWLMERMGDLWWLYVWLAWMGFNLLVLMIYPTFIAPLFNKFTPLADPQLAGRIERLLERCGFRAQGLYVMDGSRRSSHGNAYFTGFGGAKRIVLFDTLLSRLAPAEVEAVLAHELGHFKRHHVLKRVTLLFAASLGMLWALGRMMGEAWFYAGLNVESRGTAVALLLFFLVVPVFTFFLLPITSMYSRRHEFEADAYAASNASSADLANALVKLYQDNAATLTPDPLHSAFYDSHPPAASRIARLQSRPSAG